MTDRRARASNKTRTVNSKHLEKSDPENLQENSLTYAQNKSNLHNLCGGMLQKKYQ